jgi:hypothetical protein
LWRRRSLPKGRCKKLSRAKLVFSYQNQNVPNNEWLWIHGALSRKAEGKIGYPSAECRFQISLNITRSFKWSRKNPG